VGPSSLRKGLSKRPVFGGGLTSKFRDDTIASPKGVEAELAAASMLHSAMVGRDVDANGRDRCGTRG
jgi:hypothetical protein